MAMQPDDLTEDLIAICREGADLAIGDLQALLIKHGLLEGAEQKCEICGSTDDLRRAPMMRLDPAPTVCSQCMEVWYDAGFCTAEEIRKERGLT